MSAINAVESDVKTGVDKVLSIYTAQNNSPHQTKRLAAGLLRDYVDMADGSKVQIMIGGRWFRRRLSDFTPYNDPNLSKIREAAINGQSLNSANVVVGLAVMKMLEITSGKKVELSRKRVGMHEYKYTIKYVRN